MQKSDALGKASAEGTRGYRVGLKSRETVAAYLFLAPFIILFSIFVIRAVIIAPIIKNSLTMMSGGSHLEIPFIFRCLQLLAPALLPSWQRWPSIKSNAAKNFSVFFYTCPVCFR
jgi:hypothetical protein